MFIINEKKYDQKLTEQLLNNIINEIKKCPPPKIRSSNASDIEADETVLCLQREITYVDLLNPFSKIKYIGTKNLVDCVLAYIHTETDHIIVHVDSSKNILDLDSMLSCFSYQDTIKVTLIGGLIEPGVNPLRNLQSLIVELYKTAQQLDLRIEITHQKILEYNTFPQDPSYQFIYDRILFKTDILKRQWFSTPLSEEDFKNTTPLNFKYLQNKKTENVLIPLSELIAIASEVYDPAEQHFKIIQQLLLAAKKHYKNPTHFIEDIKGLISINGYKIMQEVCKDVYRNHLCNFVFDLKTGEIHVIDPHLKTVDEAIRYLYSLDRQRIHYFVSYNGRLCQEFSPKLSFEQTTICTQLNDYVVNNIGSRKEIGIIAKNSQLGIMPINGLLKNTQAYLKTPSKITTSNQCFFQTASKWQSLYENNPVENGNLLTLQKFTKLPFNAKIRLDPYFIVDAYCECNNLFAARTLKASLEEHQIIAYIVTIWDKDEDLFSFHICVPGINIKSQTLHLSKLVVVDEDKTQPFENIENSFQI
jgi:hypothetical protein